MARYDKLPHSLRQGRRVTYLRLLTAASLGKLSSFLRISGLIWAPVPQEIRVNMRAIYRPSLLIPLVGLALIGQSADQGKSYPDHMEHRVSDARELAKVFDDPSGDAWQMPDRAIATLDLKRGQVVADIGAGTGYFSVRLAKSAALPKVYAVDIEPSLVSYLKERATKEGLTNIIASYKRGPNLPTLRRRTSGLADPLQVLGRM